MKEIAIAGAGIGGLTAAIALKKHGFNVEIFEHRPEFGKAGSGIILALNAMQVYRRLGLYKDILENANYINSMNALTQKLQPLTGAKFEKFEGKYGVKAVAIHRSTLHEILLKHIGSSKIHLKKKLTGLEEKEGRVSMFFEDGTRHRADILIGADGIHSNVRKSIFEGTELRDAGQICWRGISGAELDGKYRTELNEIWGRGKRFGFVHISRDKSYWFALIGKKKFESEDPDLTELFSEFPQPVKEIIQGTEKEDIICNEIWDLKPLEKWHRGRVCLLGDAAHATTPNMGQGAAQAIESAMALSICLKEEEDAERAFSRYEMIRKKKAAYISETSWFLGKVAQSDNRIVCSLRNLIARMTPMKIAENQSDKVFSLNY